MPINIAALKQYRKRLTVSWEGETVVVVYRPYSWELEKAIAANDEKDPAPLVVRQLAELLVGWDITVTEGGEPYPITRESLGALPDPFLQAINSAILKDMYPNPKSGGITAAT